MSRSNSTSRRSRQRRRLLCLGNATIGLAFILGLALGYLAAHHSRTPTPTTTTTDNLELIIDKLKQQSEWALEDCGELSNGKDDSWAKDYEYDEKPLWYKNEMSVGHEARDADAFGKGSEFGGYGADAPPPRPTQHGLSIMSGAYWDDAIDGAWSWQYAGGGETGRDFDAFLCIKWIEGM
ncbi:hypothetical protein JOL62DRAFT_616819 [Phyllosticta paracitricarpa]|uniref:Uncharacterized protein n=1 Tax=Phyllosticta paracitricarpa TaxID=2016321 RepID=A0ABR1MVJ7_9PEZI